jgi:hypothetical protein
VAQVNHGKRLRHRAQARHELTAAARHRLLADDHAEAIGRLGMPRPGQFVQVMDVERLQIQKAQQRQQRARLRIGGLDHNDLGISHYSGLLPV